MGGQSNHFKTIGLAALISGLLASITIFIWSRLFAIEIFQNHSEKIIDSYFLNPEEFIRISVLLFGIFLFFTIVGLVFAYYFANDSKQNIFKLIGKILIFLLPYVLSFCVVCLWLIIKNSESDIVFIPSFMILFLGHFLVAFKNSKIVNWVGLVYLIIGAYSFFDEAKILLYFLISFGFLNCILGIVLIVKSKKIIS